MSQDPSELVPHLCAGPERSGQEAPPRNSSCEKEQRRDGMGDQNLQGWDNDSEQVH